MRPILISTTSLGKYTLSKPFYVVFVCAYFQWKVRNGVDPPPSFWSKFCHFLTASPEVYLQSHNEWRQENTPKRIPPEHGRECICTVREAALVCIMCTVHWCTVHSESRQLVGIMRHNVTGRRPRLLLNATTCLVRPNIQCQGTTKKCTFRFISLQLITAPTNEKISFHSRISQM